MSDTPRTDAFRSSIVDMNDPAHIDAALIFARALERELTAMTTERDNFKDRWITAVKQLAKFDALDRTFKALGLRK